MGILKKLGLRKSKSNPSRRATGAEQFINQKKREEEEANRLQELLEAQMSAQEAQTRQMQEYYQENLRRQEEYNDQMAAMQFPLEPEKAATDAYSAASEYMRREQLRRRGLLSTFTRYGQDSMAPSTSGKATLLGG